MSKDMMDDKARSRVLKLLGKGTAECGSAAGSGKLILENDRGERIAVDATVLLALASDGLVSRSGRIVRLKGEGAAAARREASVVDRFQGQHRDLDTIIVDGVSGQHAALVNLSESPLCQLVRRKTKAGEPFLSHGEFTAGERLRSDYTRGQIMPRMGANWVASVSSGKRGGGVADLTDAALAARQRVDLAIEAVGPELSGVLIDVCCFLKGLELVEAERSWPVRSAKIVLKSALGVLARHYNPGAGSHRGRKVLHWGAADYRPKLG
ncbi:DUF6456 domain-containing protein [Aminobacter sp. AP02]|uniref:DUF6456 domain-containing protein n=1 Tax=Aminobacter sp. AP02 TaxID=2135737 RepID=UPI000D79E6D3|nr:DUF6456 domain-containing protein [Aminobacter sp. AP02]PWK75762.1 hypothetical protein C8K44_103331 [Aminobacter sp. AP02]